ncbi:DUF1826 domain-containing protein [Acetobacter conturbans]|nr:DUF1826 domain-containing protein [Acetobacter conturbans]
MTVALAASCTRPPPGSEVLVEDMLDRVRLYQRLTGVGNVRFPLERIFGDSCRRFHVDHVTLRLLCTYASPGVQWKFTDAHAIHETKAGVVTVLKGLCSPGWSETGAVLHHSPPLFGAGCPG